ncbi:MAG: glycoside hydrolase family 3 N-terminal domain-containing protein [Lachnospirales bacterium]
MNKEILKKMTLKEKIGQLNQKLYGFEIYEVKGKDIEFNSSFKEEVENYGGIGTLYGLYRADPWSKKDYSNGLYGKTAIKAYNAMQKYIIDNTRLKIPALLSSECPHGHQALDGYLLPVNLAMGSTFNTQLIYDAYSICGKQLKSLGVDLALISLLDVARDPRWGRTEECFSEDPVLCSKMAEEVVKAVQNSGVYVVAKHFAAQGEGTGGINASAARIGERELREIHLPPMAACAKANVKGVMAAYNEIDGIYCHNNKFLLKDILRDEMRFDGIIMADGCAIDRLDTVTGDNVLSGAEALLSGINISLWDNAFTKLDEAVEKGYITEEKIDEAVLKILNLKRERGLFENPFIDEIAEENLLEENLYTKHNETLEIARQSIILLENKNEVLPIKSNIKNITLVGPNAHNLYNQLGDYSPQVREEDGITVLEGIKNSIKSLNLNINLEYTKDWEAFSKGKNIKKSDLTIVVLGGNSNRFGEVEFDTNGAAITSTSITMDCGEGVDTASIELPEVQQKLLKDAIKYSKKTIAIVIGGRPYTLGNLANKVDSLIYSFYPGIKGGQGISEVLFGIVNPSGRLPISIPKSTGQIPAYYNYKKSYSGRKYYNMENAQYDFGSGKSYTNFTFKKITLNKKVVEIEDLKKEDLTLNILVENTGKMDGYCVPLLFISPLQRSTVPRVKELKNFKKVFLQAEETKEITINLNYSDFSSWDKNMNFTVEAGKLKLILEESAEEIWNTEIQVK